MPLSVMAANLRERSPGCLDVFCFADYKGPFKDVLKLMN